MNTVQMLVVSERMINTTGHEVKMTNTDENAIEILHRESFDVVLAEEGDSVHSKKLEAIVAVLHPDTIFLKYEGEDADAVNNKIIAAQDKQRLERRSKIRITDTLNPINLIDQISLSN